LKNPSFFFTVYSIKWCSTLSLYTTIKATSSGEINLTIIMHQLVSCLALPPNPAKECRGRIWGLYI